MGAEIEAVKVLTDTQRQQFDEQGFLLLDSVLDTAALAKLTGQFNQWVEESRSYTDVYCETVDGRARFDLEPGHSAQSPRVA